MWLLFVLLLYFFPSSRSRRVHRKFLLPMSAVNYLLYLYLNNIIACMKTSNMKKQSFAIVHLQFRSTAWKESKYGVIAGPYFPVFSCIYGLNIRIRSKYGKIRTRKNSIFRNFSCSKYQTLTLYVNHIFALTNWLKLI